MVRTKGERWFVLTFKCAERERERGRGRVTEGRMVRTNVRICGTEFGVPVTVVWFTGRA